MARKPMITRSIPTTKVTALCVNPETREVTETTITLPRTYKDEKALMKALANAETSQLKVVSVLGTEVNETLYGMDEQKFIDNAEILPPRKRTETNEEN
jgi:hypothetical protein